jgi:regulator of cell morphogenesis and NO signaling
MQDLAAALVADIAVAIPGATAVFRRHKLDYCCGGRVALGTAAGAKGIDLAGLIDELDVVAQASAARVEAPQSTPELIDLIVIRYHQVHRRELPELVKLARRVEAVHRDHPRVPAGLADLLERIQTELGEHMQKEEQVLFPLMLRGGHPMIGGPISVMLAEHDDTGAQLRAMEKLTDDFTPPEGACTSWRALYAGARKLADDLITHIHTENNVLFPRFAPR